MQHQKPKQVPRFVHRFAVVLSFGVLGLISAGALVKSLEAGLSVPDWPLSYGGINPPRWWQIENVRAEHGHRLLAGLVASATVALAILLTRLEPRRWVRRTAILAVVTVLAQALLGGITVLFYLPTAVSSSHAALAQVFFCLILTLAVVTSGFWLHAGRPGEATAKLPSVVRLATATAGLIYMQILLGAVMRHMGAGLAIPDFPTVFGGILPPEWTAAISIHFAHRVGALLVSVFVLWTVVRALWSGSTSLAVRLPALAMTVLVLAQVTLGAMVVLSSRAVVPNTVHVATGGALLAVTLLLSLTSRRIVHRSSLAMDESSHDSQWTTAMVEGS